MSNGTSNTQSSSSFEPREILAIIARRKWIALGISLPIIFIVAISTMRSTNSVTAATRVLVESYQPEDPTFDRRNRDEDATISTSAEVAMSIPVARLAAGSLIDSIPVLRAENPEILLPRTEEDLVGALVDGISANRVGASRILILSFTHTSQRFAMRAVDVITEAFMEFSVRRLQNPQAVAYYTEQILTVQNEVDSLMALRADLMDHAGLYTFTENPTAAVNQISVLEQEFFKVRSNAEGLERQLDNMRELLEGNPDYVPRGGASTQAMKRQLEEEKAELGRLRLEHTDESVFVRRQIDVVASARSALHAERDNLVQTLQLELDELRGREESMRQAIDQQQSILLRYPEFARHSESLDLQISTRRDLLESLQFKRGEVRIRAVSDQRISSMMRLDEPFIRSRVGGSKKMLYLVVAGIFSVIMGLTVAIFVDNQDSRILDRRRAEQLLDVPVLGSVSAVRGDDAR